jgi:catechol 2,3-dioxygenase-like lactoylglutathione lyase family enzyme
MHVCYEAGDLNALYKFLAEGGLKPSAVRKAGAGNLISSTNDPDGRVTEFTQYMPGSRHTLDRGQHLGAHRVATELLGFNLTAANFVAEKQFFIDLGFEAQEAGANVRFTALGAPGLHIELLPARRGLQPQVLFPVADARQTEKQLKEAGLAAERNGRLVFVRDPDGNAFVFLETGAKNK